MASFVKETFTDQTIVLDGNSYTNCKFFNCQLIYEGGTLPVLKKNLFDSCVFDFEGPSKRTLDYLRMLYLSGGEQLIKYMMDQVIMAPESSESESIDKSSE